MLVVHELPGRRRRQEQGVVGHRLALNSVAVLDAMLDTGDEDAKLAALEQATTRLIKSLFAFVGLLAVGLLVLLAPWKLAVQLPWSMLTTWSHVLSLSLGATAGLFVPMRRQAVSSHAPLDQLWHRMVLNHPNVHLWLMRRDIAAWQRQGGTPKPGFLLITALRAPEPQACSNVWQAPTVFTAWATRTCRSSWPPILKFTTPAVARSASAATAMASWWGSTRPKPWRRCSPSNHPKGILRV